MAPLSDFERLLQESVKTHGHLCPGQVLGVRMSLLGLREIGIEEPKGKDRKGLIVFVEMDRCATDAIQSVTGCSLGHRTMKFVDYGKMAATFLNLKNKRAVRVIAKEDARKRAKELLPEIENRYAGQIEAYKIMTDEELFDMMDVTVTIKPEDMPGRTLRRVRCDLCCEYVQDMREVMIKGKNLCRSCVDGGYYKKHDFLLTGVMHISHNAMGIKSKLWVEVGGEPVFGRGRRFLLEAVARHGSINQAAKEINISYRKAWSYIKTMEERLGFTLVERRTGGRDGGGAVLTRKAEDFLRKYELMEEGIREIVDEKFHKIFGNP